MSDDTPTLEPPTLDPAALAQLHMLDEDGALGVVREIIEVYMRTTQTHWVEMTAALAADDAKTAHRMAHTMKGASLTVGAMRLAEHCRVFENDQNFANMATAKRDLDATIVALQAVLDAG